MDVCSLGFIDDGDDERPQELLRLLRYLLYEILLPCYQHPLVQVRNKDFYQKSAFLCQSACF